MKWNWIDEIELLIIWCNKYENEHHQKILTVYYFLKDINIVLEEFNILINEMIKIN